MARPVEARPDWGRPGMVLKTLMICAEMGLIAALGDWGAGCVGCASDGILNWDDEFAVEFVQSGQGEDAEGL